MTVTFAVFISVILDKFLDNSANVCVVEWKGSGLEALGPRGRVLDRYCAFKYVSRKFEFLESSTLS